MMIKQLFEVPDDSEIMSRLVTAVSGNWRWVHGGLTAPKELIVSGGAEENTGYEIGRFHTIHPTIIGQYEKGKSIRQKPNLFAMMVENKLPGFLYFDEAGFDSAPLTFFESKRIAAGFIRKGYRGRLDFYSDCDEDNMFINSARCKMMLWPWQLEDVARNERSVRNQTFIKLEWEKTPRGINHIFPLLDLCTTLNLRVYEPPVPIRA